MKRAFCFLLAFSALAPLHAEPPKVTATDVLAEFDRLAAQPLWPEFQPGKMDVAIYDGERTIVAHEPLPLLPRFKREGDLWVFPGRYPEMKINGPAEIDGSFLMPALIVDPTAGRSAREWAALLIHETFHFFFSLWRHQEVYQAQFLYPADDAAVLAARRLETEGFRRALAARDAEEAACWADWALQKRQERFGRMPSNAVEYERLMERQEGLAVFIENLSLGKTSGPDLPASGYGAEAIPDRVTAIGYAEATLLERLYPAARPWRKDLRTASNQFGYRAAELDQLLGMALVGRPDTRCGLTQAEIAAVKERAQADVRRLRQTRRKSLDAYLRRPGWKIEIVSAAHPLQLRGFDPLNVSLVAPGEILHGRYLELGNEGSTLKVLDAQALTQGAGEHPLFNGVKDFRMTGLPEPKTRQEGDLVVIEAAGLTAKLKGAKVEKGDKSVKFILP